MAASKHVSAVVCALLTVVGALTGSAAPALAASRLASSPNAASTSSTYTQAGVGYVPLAPSRLLDTRSGIGAPKGLVAAAGLVQLQVTGRGGVPASGVSAVVLNVTATQAAGAGFVTVYPTGASKPTAS